MDRPLPECRVIRCRCQVSGRVQGVGYRRFVADCAAAHGLAGFVRNLPDGAVLVEAEGPAAAVQALLPLLRRGPPFAAVREVLCTELPLAGERAFSIR